MMYLSGMSLEIQRPALAPDQEGLVEALVQTAFATMAVLNRVGADNDLSLTQLRVLAILRDRRLGMTALADYLGLDKSTMTGLVGRAERRGLLRRAPSTTDGRGVDVVITPAGAALGDRLYADVARSLAHLTEELTPRERRALQTHLERMLRARTV
jgi:DNA-binding MarR family transcriptional regulator